MFRSRCGIAVFAALLAWCSWARCASAGDLARDTEFCRRYARSHAGEGPGNAVGGSVRGALGGALVGGLAAGGKGAGTGAAVGGGAGLLACSSSGRRTYQSIFATCMRTHGH